MITERVIIIAIVVAGIVLLSLIGTVGSIFKEKGKKDYEPDDDHNV